MNIRLAHSVPFGCYFPWHLRHMDGGQYGAICCFCQRDVGVPGKARGQRVACIYCGLDRGLIPVDDAPLL